MLEVVHRRQGADGAGWIFDCLSAPAIHGGGRSYRESVESSEHAARHYLSREAGFPLDPVDCNRQLRHLPPVKSTAA
jgi:hypothetical protein